MKNVSIPKGIEVDNVDLIQAKFLCSLTKGSRTKSRNRKRYYFKLWKIWSLFKM